MEYACATWQKPIQYISEMFNGSTQSIQSS